MYTFLLVVHAIIAALLVGVILMQQSEGGGLTGSSNAGGLMSARGAADFLTRATSVLATIFIVMSIILAALATVQRGGQSIDTSLAKKAAPAQQPGQPAPAQPAPAPAGNGVPLAR